MIMNLRCKRIIILKRMEYSDKHILKQRDSSAPWGRINILVYLNFKEYYNIRIFRKLILTEFELLQVFPALMSLGRTPGQAEYGTTGMDTLGWGLQWSWALKRSREELISPRMSSSLSLSVGSEAAIEEQEWDAVRPLLQSFLDPTASGSVGDHIWLILLACTKLARLGYSEEQPNPD